MKQHIGQRIIRKEDHRLLTGAGRFTDDFSLPGQAYAAIVRSPHAHAEIKRIDSAVAARMPGVLAVYTGADCAADGLRDIPHSPLPRTRHDMKLHAPGARAGDDAFVGGHALLPLDKARYVGEALAMVVASSRDQAQDAAERVEIDFVPLAAVTDTRSAAQPGAPRLWDELADNVFIETFYGDEQATDAAFAKAAHIFSMGFHIGRVTGVPLEPRAALGDYVPQATGRDCRRSEPSPREYCGDWR